MKILFVDLTGRSRLFKHPTWMPLLLAPSAAALRAHGHEVSLAEWGQVQEECGFDQVAVLSHLRRQVEVVAPELVILNVPFEYFGSLIPAAREIRASAPKAIVIAAGGYPTAIPRETLRDCAELDAVLVGEPEIATMRLAEGVGLLDAPSLVVPKNGTFVENTVEPVEDLDSLPFPAWDLYDMAHYTKRSTRIIPCIPIRAATVHTTRGCSAACTFCTEGRLYHPRLRSNSPEYVTEMLIQLVKQYDVNGIIFRDEMFLRDVERAAEVCERMIQQGLAKQLKWTAQVRTDAVSPDILTLMRSAGCVQLELGIETGSDRMLKRLAKGATVEQSARAIEMAREAGIRSMADLMYGMPEETAKDAEQTMQFIARTNPDMVRLNPFVPFPGTAAMRTMSARGKISPDVWSLQGPHTSSHSVKQRNVSDMTDKELRHAARRLYYGYTFPRYVKDLTKHGGAFAILSAMRIRGMVPFLWNKIVPPLAGHAS